MFVFDCLLLGTRSILILCASVWFIASFLRFLSFDARYLTHFADGGISFLIGSLEVFNVQLKACFYC